MELTAELPTEEVSKFNLREVKGQWVDISRLRLKKPDVLRTIIWMLGHNQPVREIAKLCRVSGHTVLAVLNDPEHAPKIQTQRAHFTTQAKNALRLGIEATVEKYANPKAKAPPVFDLHLLHQMVALDEGGATVRMEHTFKLPESQAESELYHMIDVKTSNVETGHDQPRLEEGGKEVRGMGSSPQNAPALPAPADPPQAEQPTPQT